MCCEKQDEPWETYEVLVDALTGEALFVYKISCDLSANGTDMNNNSREFSVEKIRKGGNTQYRLKDTQRHIEIYNPNSKKPITRNKNKWSRKEISAMANMRDIYDYFLIEFNRKSYDDKGGSIRIRFDPTIHNNAKWRGTYMAIGEGSGNKYKPQSFAAGKDVLAHEYSHGIILNHTKLIYDLGTIGTISEAYADIFACYADGNWEIGEDVVKKGCLRDVAIPKNSNCATRAAANDKYYIDDSNFYNDNGGIHKNSTVISHVAYRMAGSRYSVSSKQIWYESLRLGYETYSDLFDVRDKVVAAARALHCSNNEVNEIVRFFGEAGIDSKCQKSKSYFKKLVEHSRTSLKKGSIKENINIAGKVVKADKDFDLDNNSVLGAVLVKDSTGKEIAKTDMRGNYLADMNVNNPIVLNFSKPGFLNESMYISDETIIEQDTRYCDMVELIPNDQRGKGKGESGWLYYEFRYWKGNRVSEN